MRMVVSSASLGRGNVAVQETMLSRMHYPLDVRRMPNSRPQNWLGRPFGERIPVLDVRSECYVVSEGLGFLKECGTFGVMVTVIDGNVR